jgi:hypothetical protein
MTGTTNTVGWLDWRHHSVGPARPCRICARPAMCRDHLGLPCHKVCAEQQPAAADDGPDALVVDMGAYRTARAGRRTA